MQGLSLQAGALKLLEILANLFNRVGLPGGAVTVARSDALSTLLRPLQDVCPASYALVAATNAATLRQLTAYLSDFSEAAGSPHGTLLPLSAQSMRLLCLLHHNEDDVI